MTNLILLSSFAISLDACLYFGFGAFILLTLILDLGFFQKKQHIPSFKNTLLQTAFWFVLASIFGAMLWLMKGHETGAQFFSGYLMEWSLSADNIFVFILILKFFKMPESSHQRVLFWGILGAIIFRAIFIALEVLWWRSFIGFCIFLVLF